MRSNNIIVVHRDWDNASIRIDIDKIKAISVTDNTTLVYLGGWDFISVREDIATVMNKIKTVENNKNKEN